MIEPWIIGGVLLAAGLGFFVAMVWWDVRRREAALRAEAAPLTWPPPPPPPPLPPPRRAPTAPPPTSAPYRDGVDSRLAALHAEIDRVEGELAALREQARAIGARS